MEIYSRLKISLSCYTRAIAQEVLYKISEAKNTDSDSQNLTDLTKDFACEVVPLERRSSVWLLSLQFAGVTICVSGLFSGAALSKGLDVYGIVLSILIGNLILATCAGLVGSIGAKLGISTTMISRRAFGKIGSYAVSLMATVTLIGWYAVQVGFFGDTINAMCGDFGFLTSKQGAGLWGGLLMMGTAYFGYRGLGVLSSVAVPLLVGLSTWGLFKAVDSLEIFNYVPSSGSASDLSTGITMTVGGFAVGAVLMSDLTRYARSQKDAWIATAVGFLLVNSYIIFAGAITAISTGTGDLPKAMLSLGLGIPALLILVLAQWTTNDTNLYSASLAVSNAVKIKKSNTVLILGLLATAIGVAGLAEQFITWLTYLGILIPPVAGIIICDFWILKRNHMVTDRELNGDGFAAINPVAFIAWGLGAASGFLLPFGIQSVNSLVTAFLIYLIGENIKLKAKTQLSSKQ